ncbi:hypothetical protein KKG81_02710 [bacterium]|nr:hypothetical protein [bacterium]
MFSIETHRKEHRLKLGESIKDRFKIYLDTKYWGYLCDVSLGKNTDKNLIEIYNTLIKLSKEKKIICPLSYRLYSELFKQKDINRFNETTKIMELLSENIIIMFEMELIKYELLYFLYENLKGKDAIYETDIFVWSKVCDILGAIDFEPLPFLSNENNEFIQKKYFKDSWEYTFSEFVRNKLDEKKESILINSRKDMVNTINKEKVEFEHELKTQHKVYMSEIAGLLTANKDRIKFTFSYFATNETNSKEQIGNEPEDDIQPIINMIYNLFDNKKIDTYFPTFDIRAKMFSTIRWNKNQNFKVNDLDDIGHITTALPYYDYFFTEKSFSTLIKNVEYDKKYSCCVEWKAENILNILKQL